MRCPKSSDLKGLGAVGRAARRERFDAHNLVRAAFQRAAIDFQYLICHDAPMVSGHSLCARVGNRAAKVRVAQKPNQRRSETLLVPWIGKKAVVSRS